MLTAFQCEIAALIQTTQKVADEMKSSLELILVRILLILTQITQRSFSFDFFHIGRNSTTNSFVDSNQHDCKLGQRVLNPTPCFASDVKISVVVHEGENAELRCFVYNVDFTKTLVSCLVEEMSNGLV